MPRKSHRGVTKRFKVTKHGKILAQRAGYQRKLTKKSASQKRRARRGMEIKGKEKARIKRMISSRRRFRDRCPG